MTAWEWAAGTWSGLSDDRRKARRHVAALLRSGEAPSAFLQQVVVIPGSPQPNGNYPPVTGTRVEGRKAGRGIWWRWA